MFRKFINKKVAKEIVKATMHEANKPFKKRVDSNVYFLPSTGDLYFQEETYEVDILPYLLNLGFEYRNITILNGEKVAKYTLNKEVFKWISTP